MQKSMPKEAVSEYLKSIMKENRNIKTYLGASVLIKNCNNMIKQLST